MNIKIRNILVVCVTQALVYLILFLVIPNLSILQDDIVHISVIILFLLVIYVYVINKYSVGAFTWFIGIPVIWLLIMIYHPIDIYGISSGRFGLDFFPEYVDALIFSLALFMMQEVLVFILNFLTRRLQKG